MFFGPAIGARLPGLRPDDTNVRGFIITTEGKNHMYERLVKKAETDDVFQHMEEKIRRQLAGTVSNLHLILSDDGLVMRGCVRSYYSKQLAQHAVMKLTKVRIRANEIEVTGAYT